MKLADGNIIEGKLMMLKSIARRAFHGGKRQLRGSAKRAPDPPVILGGSFLSHFVVKLNQRAGELHLTEIKDDKKSSKPVLLEPAAK